MEQNRFWELLAKMNAGEASPEEQLEFNQALMQSKEYQDLAREMTVFWKMPLPPAAAVGRDETGRKWEQVRRKIGVSKEQEEKTKGVITSIADEDVDKTGVGETQNAGGRIPPQHIERRWLQARLYRISAAAAVIIAVTSFAWWWSGHDLPGPIEKNVISTKYGSKSKIELPDGTQVWLNGGSRIVYDESFGLSGREIELEGEAYFDVARNAGKPFIIHTREMDVKVLGTVFNVRAYPNDKTTEASLIRGSIEISFPARPAEKLILKPNEKISIANTHKSPDTVAAQENKQPGRTHRPETPLMSVSKLTYQPADSTIVETAWTKNQLIFRSESFENLSADMERWFNVTIRFADPAIREKIFTGTFYNESITEALEALKLSYPFQYRFDKAKNVITLYGN